MPLRGGDMLVEVASIQVFKHSSGPCRNCGELFEQRGGKFGCGCSGLAHCPYCGCPVTIAINDEKVHDRV